MRVVHRFQGLTSWELLCFLAIVRILCAVTLLSFLNTAEKDGPTLASGRRMGQMTHVQVKYFLEYGKFSRTTSMDEESHLKSVNYHYKFRLDSDLVFHYAQAKSLKAKVAKSLGPFHWEQESNTLLISHVSAIAVKYDWTQPLSSTSRVLEVIYCDASHPSPIPITDPIYKNGSLICGEGTRKIYWNIYSHKNPEGTEPK